MHSNAGRHGGDLNTDTVTIIGATLDLQEKVVRQVSLALVVCLSAPCLLTATCQGHDADQ